MAAACPLADMESFISRRRCPNSPCPLKPSDLLVRNEQKLVDTMMAADLFSLHLSGSADAVVVSSDDDLLPVIRLLVSRGVNVVHLLTRPPNAALPHYVVGLDRRQYVPLQM